MDIDIQKQPTNHVKDRVLRFKPVAFIKKNWLVFAILFIFSLTMLVGIWNIKKYTLTDINGQEVPLEVANQIDEYIQNNLKGRNYFFFSTMPYEKDMAKTLQYLKDVNIEKIVPNKLEIFVEIYKPVCTAYLHSNSCYLLSEEGYVLNQICEEEVENCCKQTAETNNIYMFSSSDTDISPNDSGKQTLIILENVSKITKVIMVYDYAIEGITLNGSILEVTLNTGQVFRFNMSDNLDIQLERYIAVANRVKSDNLEFKSIDFRFERPVLKK